MATENVYDPALYCKRLYEAASTFEVDNSIPIRRYYRSGTEMERQARIYDKEGNKERAYILYTKFCILFLEKIRLHPKSAEVSPEDKAKVKKLLKPSLARAEVLKKELTDIQRAKIDAFLKRKQEEEDRSKRQQEEEQRAVDKLKMEQTSSEVALFLSGFGGEIAENTPTQQSQTVHPTTAAVAPLPTAPPSAPPMTRPTVTPSAPSDVPPPYEVGEDDTVEAWLTPGPPVPMETAAVHPPVAAYGPPGDMGPTMARVQDYSYQADLGATSVPAVSYPFVSQEEISFASIVAPPMVDRSCKPSSLSTDLDWAEEGLRTVIVSTDVPREFLNRASSNTRRNVETCGILAGNLSQGCLKVTHIVIPKQTGTSDSCDTSNEEEIFEVLDGQDLITLGWIHTHPSQSSFMSSIDLHTQCSYQLMMPEAISIVVAPKFDQVGHFTLTAPYGMETISKCRQSGFHPHHKEPPLYEESSHVRKDPSYGVIVSDLR